MLSCNSMSFKIGSKEAVVYPGKTRIGEDLVPDEIYGQWIKSNESIDNGYSICKIELSSDSKAILCYKKGISDTVVNMCVYNIFADTLIIKNITSNVADKFNYKVEPRKLTLIPIVDSIGNDYSIVQIGTYIFNRVQ